MEMVKIMSNCLTKGKVAKIILLVLVLFILILPIVPQNALAEENRQVNASEILGNITRGEPVNISNAVIIGILDVSEIKNYLDVIEIGGIEWRVVKSPISISDSTIQGTVNFKQIYFTEGIVFSNITFDNSAIFLNATFVEGAEFYACTFNDEAHFQNANFTNEADFGSAKFEDCAYLTDALFDGEASFWYASFNKTADFQKSTFNDKADFGEATFNGGASFTSVKFNDAEFKDAIFNNYADFISATFDDDAIFCNALFVEKAFFDCIFNDRTVFSNATFNNSADFSWATFNGVVSFRGVTFNDSANFIRATFNNAEADFGFAKFMQTANFNHTKFNDEANFQNARFNDTAYFRLAKFKDRAYFTDASFNDTIDFSDADIFLTMKINWSQLEGKLVYDGYFYQSLIRNFETLGQSEDANDAYYKYHVEKRKHIDIKSTRGLIRRPLEFIFLDLSCGYGVKPLKPIRWAVFFIGVFAFLYWLNEEKDKRKRLREFVKDRGKGLWEFVFLGKWKGRKNKKLKSDSSLKDGLKRLLGFLKDIVLKFVFLSVSIFTTLGYWNKWKPANETGFRILAIAEVFLGWIIMTLFVISLTMTWIR